MRRKFLFSILLFLTFVAVCVYVVIIAQGSKIDSNGNVVNTSIIRVNSVPQDVTVYINDQKIALNGNRAEWISPGTVKVTLKKAGYRTWEKLVDLKAGLIEDIYAQLYPERLNFDKLTSVNIDKFFFSNDTDYIFYSVIKGEKTSDNGLWKLKLKRNLLDIGDLVASKIYNYSVDDLIKLQKNAYDIQISDDDSKAIINYPDVKELYYLDLNNATLTLLNESLSFYPNKVEWIRNSNSIVASNGNLLVTYDVNSKAQNLVYYSPSKEIVYSLSGDDIYYYRFDTNSVYDLKNNQSTVVKFITVDKGLPITKIFSAKNNSKILYTVSGTTFNFIDLDNNIIIPIQNIKQVEAIAPSGKGVVYVDLTDKLKTLVFKNSIDLKTYTYNTYAVSLDTTTLSKIFYTQSDKNLVALITDKDNKKFIWFMDNDGLNSAQLVNNEKIIGNNIAVDSSSLGLYLMLEDTSDATENTTVNNIYRFDLEVK